MTKKIYKVEIYPDRGPEILEYTVLAETEWHWTVDYLGHITTESKASQAPWSMRATKEEALNRSIEAYEKWAERISQDLDSKIASLMKLRDLKKKELG